MALKFGYLVFGLVLVVVKAQQGYPRENPVEQLAYTSAGASQRYGEDEESYSNGDEIPGEAGKDYPTLRDVSETRFDCSQQQFSGYYADPEARCQAFHICQNGGRKDSFLCPNGTIFNQEKLVCDWWFNSDCDQAQNFYSINEAIFRAMEEADRLAAERRSAEGYRYNEPSGSRYQQQRPSSSSSSSSANIPKSDFDTVVVEAARTAPIRDQMSKFSQAQAYAQQPQQPHQGQRQIFERQEVVARGQQNSGVSSYGSQSADSENIEKNSHLTGATFGKQITASVRDAEVIQEPAAVGREYLPAQIRDNNNDNNNGY